MPGNTAIRAATADDWRALWAWMHEDWPANADDFAPADLSGFITELEARQAAGESVWVAECDGQAVGAIGYRRLSPDTGMLHGVCFTAAVHGKGVAKAALTEVLEQLKAAGVRKVSASYFADNARVRRFLAANGFEDEGYLRAQTRRDGALIDLYLVSHWLR